MSTYLIGYFQMYKNMVKKEMTKNELQELENLLPHGAKQEIINETGLSRKTIDRFFDGTWNERIYKAISNYIEELKTKEADRLLKLQGATSDLKGLKVA